MITLHHLNDSRSQRILWCLEELDLEYNIEFHTRDSLTMRAPDSLKAVHPLGRAPILTDDSHDIAESGAIIDYVLRRYGAGRFIPDADNSDYDLYQHFMHYAEGSAMFPLLLALYVGFLGDGATPLSPIIDAEIKTHFSYIEDHLTTHKYFAGDELSGADFIMIFPLETAHARGRLNGYGACTEYVKKIHMRPAYQRALHRGGDYAFAAPIHS